MESQTIELGAATLAALQALVRPVGMTPLAWVALGVGLGQLVLLGVGLGLMYRSNTSRERQTQALERAEAQRHAEAMEALREQSQALGKIGQALDRQGEAMTQAFTQQGQALERQGEVLAELLRRSA